METEPKGLTSDRLIALLAKRRVNDVYVEVTDADEDELGRFQVHGVRYMPDSETIEILARKHYRGS